MFLERVRDWLKEQDRTFVVEISHIITFGYLGTEKSITSIDDITQNMREWLDAGTGDMYRTVGRAVCAKALIDFAFEYELCPDIIDKRKAARQASLEHALAEDLKLGTCVAGSVRMSIEKSYPAQIARWAAAKVSWDALKKKELSSEAFIASATGNLPDPTTATPRKI